MDKKQTALNTIPSRDNYVLKSSNIKSWYLKRHGEIEYGHQKYQKERRKTPGFQWLGRGKRGGEGGGGGYYRIASHIS